MNLRAIVFVLLMSLNAGISFAAPERVGQWDFGLNVSGTGYTEDNYGDAVYVGGNLNYNYNEWLTLGGQVGWSPASVDFPETIGGDKKKAADVHVVPILGTVTARATQIDPSFVPYGVFGVGAAIVNTEKEGDFIGSLDEESGTMAKLGAGFDWYFERDTPWVLNFEFAYYFTEADLRAKSGDSVIDEAALDFWLVGAGVKYLFE